MFKLARRNWPLAALMLCQACSLNTEVNVADKPLPEQFSQQASGPSLARINWRDYFTDPHLLALIDAAVANNPDVQLALQRIEAARSSVKLANGALFPQVGLNIGGGVRKFGLYTMDGAGNASTEITPGQIVPENLPDIFVGLQSSWEVDVWGKLDNQRKAAAAQYGASVEATNWVMANLVADVALYYNELLALDNQLDIIRETLHNQRRALEVVEIQKQAGRANQLAVQQFKAQLLNAQGLENDVLLKISEAENQINYLLGRYPQTVLRDKKRLLEPTIAPFDTGLPSQLLENRPDIREANMQVEATGFDVQAAKAAFLPNFNISATLGFQAFNPEFLFSSPASLAYSLMGTLIAPLINRYALEAQFNTAKANQISALYQYQKTILNAYVEVSNALANIKYLQQVSSLKKQQTEVLQQATQTADVLYQAARANYLEVLAAQQNALQANLDLINTQKQQKNASIKIYKALGGGWK